MIRYAHFAVVEGYGRLPVTNMYNNKGEETEDLDEVVSYVAKAADNDWLTVRGGSIERVTYH